MDCLRHTLLEITNKKANQIEICKEEQGNFDKTTN